MMQPYEIVKAAIQHQGPSRLPLRFEKLGWDDTAFIPFKVKLPWELDFDGVDDWGCLWETTDMGTMGQVKGHPLKSLDDINHTKVPDWDDDSRYTDVPAALDDMEKEGKYVLAGIFMLVFERMHSLYGFENVLIDLKVNQKPLKKLADLIVEVQLNFVENIHKRFGSRVHGFHMSDDWGTQQAGFISLDLWMDFFYPCYKRIFNRMHDYGYDVWLHSCGRVNELIEGFIRAGVDVVNLQQPRAMGIAEIGERYRGRIGFESAADIQHTLPTKDLAKIKQDAILLMTHWASPEGGFVLSDYGQDSDIGIDDPQVKLYMYQAFSELSAQMYGHPLPEPRMNP